MAIHRLRFRWPAALPVMVITVFLNACSDSPAPTPILTNTPTLAPTATPTKAGTPTPAPTATQTPAPTATPTKAGTPTPAPTATQTPAMDRAALVTLYEAMDGVNWKNNTNWLSEAPLGEWYGVITGLSGRVTELDLSENQLRGAIPPKLGNLANLTKLYLSENQLNGEIPPDLGDLANLRYLSLWGTN